MHRIFWLVVAATWLWQPGAVRAESPSAGGAQAQAPLAPAAVAARHPIDWQVVPAEQLAGKRAGADTVSNHMDLSGAVNGNSAINVVTGANAISTGAFSNASGLPVAIQNSGANVLIQNATIINVQMK